MTSGSRARRFGWRWARALRPRWTYPLAAGVLAGALVGVSCAEPALRGVWLALGVIAAGAMGSRLAAREESLWSLSSTDVATGLANRRHFQEAFERELAQTMRGGRPVALLLFDLDRLKAINDRLGHAMGDTALRTVAQALRRAVRAGELVARWGGDEFAIVASCANEGEARTLGARLCMAVRAASHGAMELSVSGGVALADPTRPVLSRASTLFAAADRALYRAKSAGGGRVEVGEAQLRRLRPVLECPTPMTGRTVTRS